MNLFTACALLVYRRSEMVSLYNNIVYQLRNKIFERERDFFTETKVIGCARLDYKII